MINFKSKTTKKLVIAALIVIAIQAVVLIIFNRGETLSIKDAIEKTAREAKGVDAARKAQMKIQLAVSDYRSKHGRFPKSLQELLPEYFDVIPTDPKTGKDFVYTVENGKALVGSAEEIQLAKAGKDAPAKTTETSAEGEASEATDEQKQALIASLETSEEEFIYDATGKRDPFRPFNFAPQQDDRKKTPLERYSIGQLKLTAILDGFEEPFAMVENSAGKGFRVKRGTKIGQNGGEVVEILKDRLVILERSVDFTGRESTKTLELRLRTKDQEEAQIVR